MMPLNLAYREIGSGAPLLILHGLFGSGSNWGWIAKQLSTTHRIFTVDLRNHGNSPHAETMSYPEMAEDVLALLDRLQLDKVTLLGHSMGGKTAMMAALRYPSRIERLAVVDIAPVTYHHDYHPLLNALRNIDLDQITRREEIDRALHDPIPETGLRQFLMKNLVRRDQRFQWQLNLNGIAQAMVELTGFPPLEGNTYPGKTLFLGGANSNYILRQYYQSIFRFFPHTNIVMLKNAGHWVHAEQPDALLQTVRNFITP